MKRTVLTIAVFSLALCPARAWCAGPLQRYALIVGANSGGAGRPPLQYAVSDAERFARVMIELGGVAPANEVVLRQPKLRELIDALDALTRRVAEARRAAAAAGGRTEIVLYFTHYLVSGFRGAADTSGDGKVTLNAAYQFAFNETLGRTVDTKGGAQHPSYDINLSGTGDVVMTDVRQTTATLVLGEDLEGRFFIRTAAQELVVELYKPRGRTVELAVEPGTYEVRVERQKESLTMKTVVGESARVTIDPRQFGPAALEATERRGGDRPRFSVAGRNRLELQSGMWRSKHRATTVSSGSSALDVFGGIQYTRFVREDLAVTFSSTGFGVESGSFIGPGTISSGDIAGLANFVGIRQNPFRGDHRNQALKPFIAVSLGPVIGASDGSFIGNGTVTSGNVTRVTLGGHFGGGFDVHVSRSFSIGLDAGYNAMVNFSEPVGLHKNFNGVQVALGVGWLFGKGYNPTP